MKNNFEKILDLIYPPSAYCILCDGVIDGNCRYSMCDECIEKIQWIDQHACYVCGKPMREDETFVCKDCNWKKRYFDQGFTCTRYGLYERKLISDFKKCGKFHMAKVLGDILYDRIVIEDLKIDGIIPVPIHKSRLKERGFNQTELMGRFLGKRLDVPMMSRGLVRVKKTLPMKKLDRLDREWNMNGVFQVPKPSNIVGKNLLVIDDIFTTGATLNECAKTLKSVGADNVYILTLAAGIGK